MRVSDPATDRNYKFYRMKIKLHGKYKSLFAFWTCLHIDGNVFFFLQDSNNTFQTMLF